jgi:nitronate monooxygenase
VHSRAEAVEAEQAGADIIVAQGTEAGGHTGQVATLPLLQVVLEAVSVPVLAAGGIGTPRGVAAALAAGAAGAWVGTCLLASPECDNSPEARTRVVDAEATGTVLTRAFDVGQGIPWPTEYPGRALSNSFTEQWHERVAELARDEEARKELAAAISARDYTQAQIYAGQAAGLVAQERPAGEVVRWLGEGAEQLLRERLQSLLGD